MHLIFYISLLKSFHAGGNGYSHPTALYIEDEQKWEVSGIPQHKGSGKIRKYLVVYLGYNESESSWLLLSELNNTLEIIYNFKVSHGLD